MRKQMEQVSSVGSCPTAGRSGAGSGGLPQVRPRGIHPRGPSPVGPGRPSVAMRPSEIGPRWSVEGRRRAVTTGPRGRRTMVRHALLAPAVGGSRHRALAGGVAALLAAVVVVGLGMLAEVAASRGAVDVPASVAVGPSPAILTARAGDTVWDVARRSAPGAGGAEIAMLAERIVVENALTSVRLQPGQVIRVTPR